MWIRLLPFLFLLCQACPSSGIEPPRGDVAATVAPALPEILSAIDMSESDPVWVAAGAVDERSLAPLPTGYRDWVTDVVSGRQIPFPHMLYTYEKTGCVPPTFNSISYDSTAPRDLAGLVAWAKGIYFGRVLELVPGFLSLHRGMTYQGTMVRVLVEEELRPSEEYHNLGVLNVFLEAGPEFESGGYKFCGSDTAHEDVVLTHTFHELPEVGGRMIVLPFWGPVDTDRSLVFPRFNEYYFELDGTVRTVEPQFSRFVRRLSLAEVETRVRDLARGSFEEPRP